MRSLFLLCLFILSTGALAQDLTLEENKFLGYIYQQQGYQLDDPKGDILLLWSAKQIPQTIANHLTGKGQELSKLRQTKINELLAKYPEYVPKDESANLIVENYKPFDVEDEAIALEGKKAPFRVRNVVRMFEQVITEEYRQNGILPVEGEVHRWSPKIKKEIHENFVIFSRMSKLLVALSRGATSFYMVSGSENELKAYILTRTENSINLEEMFRASYRINKGDVYLSLLTVENVLSKYWSTPKRELLAITTKLKDITNFNYQADKFGAWYHLFGVMLYGYAEGVIPSKTVGNLETLGSLILSRFQEERQESYINNRGGAIGGGLRKFIQKKGYETLAINAAVLQEAFYMNLDEDFTKRLEKEKKKKKD